MREIGALIIGVAARLNVSAFVAPSRIAMGPVNHPAERIVFVLAFHENSLPAAQRYRTGKIGVRLDAHDEAASRAESEKKAFVRADSSRLHAKETRHRAVGNDFNVRTRA